MPRESSASQALVALVSSPPLPAPDSLTDEQRREWHSICEDRRFHPEHVPVLTLLVQAMSYSNELAEELAKMRHCSLIHPRADKTREIFAGLLRMHAEQSKRIASLCTKLRMTEQSRVDNRRVEAARRVTPTQPPPWENWGRARDDNSDQ